MMNENQFNRILENCSRFTDAQIINKAQSKVRMLQHHDLISHAAVMQVLIDRLRHYGGLVSMIDPTNPPMLAESIDTAYWRKQYKTMEEECKQVKQHVSELSLVNAEFQARNDNQFDTIRRLREDLLNAITERDQLRGEAGFCESSKQELQDEINKLKLHDGYDDFKEEEEVKLSEGCKQVPESELIHLAEENRQLKEALSRQGTEIIEQDQTIRKLRKKFIKLGRYADKLLKTLK